MNNFRHVADFGSAVLIVFAIVCASVGAAAEIIRRSTAAADNLELVRDDEVREALAKYDEQCEEVNDQAAYSDKTISEHKGTLVNMTVK